MRILIVEDDFTAQELLEKILQSYGECDAAADGEAAVNLVKQSLEQDNPYDLICLDILMPNMDGQQALKEIRRLEEEHGIGGYGGARVIMTTALDDAEHIQGAYRSGCEAYLTKPYSKNDLLREMRKLGLIK